MNIKGNSRPGFLLIEITISLFFISIFSYITYSFFIKNHIEIDKFVENDKVRLHNNLIVDLVIKDMVSVITFTKHKDLYIFKKDMCNETGEIIRQWVMWHTNKGVLIRKSGNYDTIKKYWGESNSVGFKSSYKDIDFEVYNYKDFKNIESIKVILKDNNGTIIRKENICTKNFYHNLYE